MKHSLPLHSQNKGSSALVCEVLAPENLIFLPFSYSFYSPTIKRSLETGSKDCHRVHRDYEEGMLRDKTSSIKVLLPNSDRAKS